MTSKLQKKPSPKGNIHIMIFLLFWIPIQIHYPYWIRIYSNQEPDPGPRVHKIVREIFLHLQLRK